MSKQRPTIPRPESTQRQPTRHLGSTHGSTQGLTLATLGGVMLVLIISFANWREIDGIEESLDRRLVQIDTRIAQVADKVVQLPAQAAAQPPRRGPDPSKVYPIKTAGAPAKGPARAAVTVAEFSDFQ